MKHYLPRPLVRPVRWLARTHLKVLMVAYVAGTAPPWWSRPVGWLLAWLPPVQGDA